MRLPVLCVLCVTQSVAFAESPCAATPAAAMQAFAQGAPGETNLGYRVAKLRTDPALNIIWADIQRCDHPGWPGISIPTHATVSQPSESPLMPHKVFAIRPGQTVRVWRNEPNAHLEMPAISEESGAVGDRIRLHITTPNGQPPRLCFGVVRGPANVEME